MQGWIKKEFNKELSIKKQYIGIRNQGLKKRRPSNIKNNKRRVKKFKKKRIKELVKNNPNKKIKVDDESRFELITDIGRK